jgi:hypothetical protein
MLAGVTVVIQSGEDRRAPNMLDSLCLLVTFPALSSIA